MGALTGLAAVIGTVFDVEGSIKEGEAKQREAKDNAALAASAAADAIARGNQEAGRTRTDTTKLVAEQNVAYANSGVDPTVGTPASVMADTRAMGELDAKTLENNAAREAWGFRTYGMKYNQQAALEAARTQNKVAGTMLGGLGRAASGFSQTYEAGKGK